MSPTRKPIPTESRTPRKAGSDVEDVPLSIQIEPTLEERVIYINRSAKVVKGGRRFSFSALVVVGDRQGKVGLGYGKAGDVSEAIRKATEYARRNLTPVARKDSTIPHEIIYDYDGAKILLKPASPGTGIIAGRTVRAVVELAGIRDVLTKALGSTNPVNLAKATFEALLQLRTKEEIFQLRGLPVKKQLGEQSSNFSVHEGSVNSPEDGKTALSVERESNGTSGH